MPPLAPLTPHHPSLHPAVIRRSTNYAIIFGVILITINHRDAVLAGIVDAGRLAKMALTVMVPYVVSTLSIVETMRWRGRE